MVFTVCFVLSPGTGLSCPRRFVDHPAKLGASVGASGPHDLTVRDLGVRLTRGRVHRIQLPTFVTIAKRPSSRPRDARKSACDLPDGTSAFACDMLARRAICAWQMCLARGPRIAARRCRSPVAPSTQQPLRDGICSASRVCSCAEGTVSDVIARSASDEAIHSFFARRHDCFAEPVIGRAFARPGGSP